MYNVKDKNPRDTVNEIKRILNVVGISVEEIWFDSGLQNIFSVRLTLTGTEYGTNGKGITEELALASAYGELIERLGNGIIFHNNEREKTRDVGFVFFPDECMLSEKDVENEIVMEVLKPLSCDYQNAMQYWKELIERDNWICLPYKGVRQKKIAYVPYSMLRVYGSNGMSAGNTEEEALVQAVSEIFERYCQRMIIENKICPPVIDKDYIKENWNALFNIICEIEKNPIYCCEVRDCSLEYGIPVISVCIFDKEKHTDMVSFGAHPIAEIALERALSELFQGKTLKDIVNPFEKRNLEQRYNKLSLIKNGIGYYPFEFYMNKYDYEFNGYKKVTGSNNKAFLSRLLQVLEDNTKEVYTRTLCVGEMYCVQAIIPGMSEVYTYDSFIFECEEMKNRISKEFVLSEKLSANEIQMFLEYLDYVRKIPEFDLNLSKTIRSSEDREKEKLILDILIKGFFYLGAYDRVIRYVDIYMKYAEESFCRCIKCICEMKLNKIKGNTYREILKNYYSSNVLNEAESFLLNQNYTAKGNAVKRKNYQGIDLSCVRKIKEELRVL